MEKVGCQAFSSEGAFSQTRPIYWGTFCQPDRLVLADSDNLMIFKQNRK